MVAADIRTGQCLFSKDFAMASGETPLLDEANILIQVTNIGRFFRWSIGCSVTNRVILTFR